MTHDERNSILHGIFPELAKNKPADLIGSGGYVPGVPRLGVPPLQETDASLGVANPREVRKGDGATALPSSLSMAASFDPEIAYQGGAMIGSEARKKGFAVMLAGGVDLARDPRCGRNFEYAGEDPLLAGILVGESIRGIQDQHIISTVKHFVANDQETGRHVLSVDMADDALRESDLLAFEIAIERGRPGSVMCAYNRLNGTYSCANRDLLDRVLKQDWRYPGWVMSDWGAVPDPTAAALAGLDQESGEELDQLAFKRTFSDSLAVGQIPDERRDEMARRILREMFAKDVMDDPPSKSPIDYAADTKVAERAEEAGIVLLKNDQGVLPLGGGIHSIAVIGGHADVGVLSGGGSSQVIPVGGAAFKGALPKGASEWTQAIIYDPSSPLKGIEVAAPDARVIYDPGTDPAAAAVLARKSDVVIVFATQWMSEEYDAPNLSLPEDQDKLVEAVAAANPRTVVVLETGGPVLMPWLHRVGAVVEAWYPGSGGGEAIARTLFGQANPSGRLPITFPQSLDQLPEPVVPGSDQPKPAMQGTEKPFDVRYVEGSDVGYRWYAAKGHRPLFPFGYGLSYTRFEDKNLAVQGGKTIQAEFDVSNTGTTSGADTVQLYADVPARDGHLSRRLIGWRKVELKPGETRHLSIKADPRLLANFDSKPDKWKISGGMLRVHLASNAEDDGLVGTASMEAETLNP